MEMKKTACAVLSHMIELLISYLEELERSATDGDDFAYGEKTAYVECLELLQDWESAEKFRLDFNVEQRFPLL